MNHSSKKQRQPGEEKREKVSTRNGSAKWDSLCDFDGRHGVGKMSPMLVNMRARHFDDERDTSSANGAILTSPRRIYKEEAEMTRGGRNKNKSRRSWFHLLSSDRGLAFP